MLTAAIALTALSLPSAAHHDSKGRLLPTYPQFYELMMNPPGGDDDTQGREYIIIRGPENMDLDTYAIVVVENEHSSGGANDIGTVDHIIPLDGYETNSDGICAVRDQTSGGGLGVFNPSDPLSSPKEFQFQFQTTNLTKVFGYSYSGHSRTGGPNSMGYGGNNIENEGGNYFLVRYVNEELEQEHDGSTKGTALDIDHDGTLDYLEGSPPVGWIQPWDNQVLDCVFIPVKDKALGTNASTQQLDYTTAVTSYTHISQERQTASTADWFARLSDSNALVADLTAAGSNVYKVIGTDVYFTAASTYGAVVANTPTPLSNIQVKIGLVSYFTVNDSVVPANVWTH